MTRNSRVDRALAGKLRRDELTEEEGLEFNRRMHEAVDRPDPAVDAYYATLQARPGSMGTDPDGVLRYCRRDEMHVLVSDVPVDGEPWITPGEVLDDLEAMREEALQRDDGWAAFVISLMIARARLVLGCPKNGKDAGTGGD
ncbi:hypothetical protein [Falsiroseomonas sp. E2-1-a20]|uniref:hypothetical protein n=1 Tax=Falsiroseomonas sp. E2-1-a20 TaxID=3239300 RepID=UPI003F2C5993